MQGRPIERLPYATPQLTVYGSVDRLTGLTDQDKVAGPGDAWAAEGPIDDDNHPEDSPWKSG